MRLQAVGWGFLFVGLILSATARNGRKRSGVFALVRRRVADFSAGGADELACKPDSVPRSGRGGDHPSRATVAGCLVRSTRELGRAALERSLSDLAPGGVYRAARVTPGAGGLLHHRFTLTRRRGAGRSAFCGTVPRVAPGGRYPPPCPVESGLSSSTPRGQRRGRPASSSGPILAGLRRGADSSAAADLRTDWTQLVRHAGVSPPVASSLQGPSRRGSFVDRPFGGEQGGPDDAGVV